MEFDSDRDEEILQVFLESCETGFFEHFMVLLDEGVSPNHILHYQEQLQPLLYIAIMENEDMVGILLDRGADIHIPCFGFKNRSLLPLQMAIMKNSLNCVKQLLDYGADVGRMNANNECAVYTAFEVFWILSALRCVTKKMFIEHNGAWESIEAIGEFELNIALSKQILEHIVTHGLGEYGLETRIDDTYRKIFEFLNKVLNQNVVETQETLRTLDNDIIEFIEYLGPTEFGSIFVNNKEVVDLFFKSNLWIEDIILSAIQTNQFEIAELSLEKYSSLIKNQSGIVEAAIRCNHVEFLRSVVTKYKFTLESHHLLTIVTIASRQYKDCKLDIRETLEFLLNFAELDVNVKYPPENDSTPLHHMQDYRFCDIFALLLEHGADPSLRDGEGNPAVHKCGDLSTCKVLEYYKKIQLIDEGFSESELSQVLPNLTNWTDVRRLNIEEYESELNKLKSIKISERTVANPVMTLFRYMFLDPTAAVRYANNRNLRKLYKDTENDFRREFKHYGFILNHQLRKSIVRQKATEPATQLLKFAMGEEVPGEITDYVLKFYNSKELQKYKPKRLTKK